MILFATAPFKQTLKDRDCLRTRSSRSHTGLIASPVDARLHRNASTGY